MKFSEYDIHPPEQPHWNNISKNASVSNKLSPCPLQHIHSILISVKNAFTRWLIPQTRTRKHCRHQFCTQIQIARLLLGDNERFFFFGNWNRSLISWGELAATAPRNTSISNLFAILIEKGRENWNNLHCMVELWLNAGDCLLLLRPAVDMWTLKC